MMELNVLSTCCRYMMISYNVTRNKLAQVLPVSERSAVSVAEYAAGVLRWVMS